MDLFTYKQTLLQTSYISALQVLKLQNPAFDEVKYAEAVKIAGSERWLKYHIAQGNIKKIRRGTAKNSPIYYSRLEIAAVREAERQIQACANEEKYRK